MERNEATVLRKHGGRTVPNQVRKSTTCSVMERTGWSKWVVGGGGDI